MNSVTREFIWGVVLFLTGIYIILYSLDYYLLGKDLIYTIVNIIINCIGLLFTIGGLRILNKNLSN